jgi:uncharacterized membrane protein
MTIYHVVTFLYYLIVLYFAVMIFWRLIIEERLHMQVAIAIALLPFLYRLLYIK